MVIMPSGKMSQLFETLPLNMHHDIINFHSFLGAQLKQASNLFFQKVWADSSHILGFTVVSKPLRNHRLFMLFMSGMYII
jgi:hypothetical protein